MNIKQSLYYSHLQEMNLKLKIVTCEEDQALLVNT